MQKSDYAQPIKVVRRQVQPSATLNRKYVTRPQVKKTASVQVAQKSSQPTPEQLKEAAIKKALRSASKTDEETARPNKLHFGLGRIILAFACTATAIFAIAYFINQNVFNLSVANAARSAGIETTNTPKVPAGYELTDIVSEDGKMTLAYTNKGTKTSFTIIEERSSWDSNALLTNYVKPTYEANFSTVREQGITIYISDSNAAWINGRVMHKILAEPGTLTKKQIRTIALSL